MVVRKRQSTSFNYKEFNAMAALFESVLKGASFDSKSLNKPVMSVMRKFHAMRSRSNRPIECMDQ